jgi:hypothetical protein
MQTHRKEPLRNWHQGAKFKLRSLSQFLVNAVQSSSRCKGMDLQHPHAGFRGWWAGGQGGPAIGFQSGALSQGPAKFCLCPFFLSVQGPHTVLSMSWSRPHLGAREHQSELARDWLGVARSSQLPSLRIHLQSAPSSINPRTTRVAEPYGVSVPGYFWALPFTHLEDACIFCA